MAITVDEVTKNIFIPQADLTLVGPGAIYELDTEWLRGQLKNWEASAPGGWRSRTHLRASQSVVGGTTLAQQIIIINGYSITFEDGQYRVILVGSNNNIIDVSTVNQVSIVPTNSAGLIETGTSGLTAQEAADLALAVALAQCDMFFDQSAGLVHYYAKGTTTDLIPPKTVTGTGQLVDSSIVE